MSVIISLPKGGGGGISEIYNFPYSIQDTTPTPIREGHLWIKSATLASQITKLKILEAVNAGETDGTLMLVVGDLALHNMSTSHNKQSTSGDTTLAFSIADTISSTANWLISHLTGAVTSDYKVNRPFVYSKIGGVLDIETTYIWDGTAWVLLCEKDKYFAIAKVNFDAVAGLDIYNIIGNTLAKQASYSGCGQVSAAGDGRYILSYNGISSNTSGLIKVYKRSGVNLLDYYTVPYSKIINSNTYYYKHAKLSKDGEHLVVMYRMMVSPYYQVWIVYKNDGTTYNEYFVSAYSTSSSSADNYADIAISQNGEFIAIIMSQSSILKLQYAFKNGSSYIETNPGYNFTPSFYNGFRLALSHDDKTLTALESSGSTSHDIIKLNIDYVNKTLTSSGSLANSATTWFTNYKATPQGIILFANASPWIAKKIVDGVVTNYTTNIALAQGYVRTASFNIDMTLMYCINGTNTLGVYSVIVNDTAKTITCTLVNTYTGLTGFDSASGSLVIPW